MWLLPPTITATGNYLNILICGRDLHPYFDGRHREHKEAVEKMRQLHEKAFGTD